MTADRVWWMDPYPLEDEVDRSAGLLMSLDEAEEETVCPTCERLLVNPSMTCVACGHD